MRVLITRPPGEAERTAARFEAAGHAVLRSPALVMAPTGAAWPQGVVDGVIATSAQAFELLAPLPEWPLPEARRLMPLRLVGQRTHEAALRHGFTGPATVAPDMKGLMGLVAEKRGDARRFLYLAGHDRKRDLEIALVVAGHAVEVVEIYQAAAASSFEPAVLAALRDGAVDAVAHYSRRSAEIVLDLMRDGALDASRLVHLCFSDDVAEPLKAAGCVEIRVAREPNERALLDMARAAG